MKIIDEFQISLLRDDDPKIIVLLFLFGVKSFTLPDEILSKEMILGKLYM